MKPENGHWYDPKTGEPKHWVPKKDGTGNRPTTLRDAKELGLVPSVTSILNILAKPALQEWLIRNAVHAVTTAPDILGESLDAKITRVLDTERQQDEESQRAMDRGTEIHDALEAIADGLEIDAAIEPWVAPAWSAITEQCGEIVKTECVLIGPGFGGRADLITKKDQHLRIWDYKSTRKLPTEAYIEARLQLAGYAKALYDETGNVIDTTNVYISTVDCGKFVICENPPWHDTYHEGFAPLVRHWQFIKGYKPKQ